LPQSGIAQAKSPGHVASSCAGPITCNTRCDSRGWSRAKAVPAAIATKITIDRSIIAHPGGFPFNRAYPVGPTGSDCRARELNPHQPLSSTAGAPSHPMLFLFFSYASLARNAGMSWLQPSQHIPSRKADRQRSGVKSIPPPKQGNAVRKSLSGSQG